MIRVLFLLMLSGCVTEVIIEPTCDGGIDQATVDQVMLPFRTF